MSVSRAAAPQLHHAASSSVCKAVLGAFEEQFVLGQVPVVALHIEAAGAAAAAAQESTDRPALARMAHRITEHLVDLLLRRHPPVRVGSTVHSDEL